MSGPRQMLRLVRGKPEGTSERPLAVARLARRTEGARVRARRPAMGVTSEGRMTRRQGLDFTGDWLRRMGRLRMLAARRQRLARQRRHKTTKKAIRQRAKRRPR